MLVVRPRNRRYSRDILLLSGEKRDKGWDSPSKLPYGHKFGGFCFVLLLT